MSKIEQIDLSKVAPMVTSDTVNLTKGANIALSADENLNVVSIGLGWDPIKNGHAFDADATAFLLDANGKLIKDGIVYFGGPVTIGSGDTKKTASKCGGVLHSGDNTTGDGDGDDETILVEVEELDPTIEKIVFAVNIFDAASRGNQVFGMSDNCEIRLYNPETNAVLAKFDLADDYATSDAIIAGELYKKNGQWKFKANGTGTTGTINDLAATYN